MRKENITRPGVESYLFSGKGEVYSYTTVLEAAEGFEEFVPYVVALVKLEEGPLVTAMLTDLQYKTEEVVNAFGQKTKVRTAIVDIGMPLEMVTRKLGQIGDERGLLVYGYKFRPVLETTD